MSEAKSDQDLTKNEAVEPRFSPKNRRFHEKNEKQKTVSCEAEIRPSFCQRPERKSPRRALRSVTIRQGQGLI